MPQLQVTTKSANQVWASPDGQRTIFELQLEYEGKPVKAKTYSKEISVPGWMGTVETYEKPGRNGVETFVKQPPKEGASYGGGGASTNRGGGGYSKPMADPFTMYLSYAKDIAGYCFVTDAKGKSKFDDVLYAEVLEAVAAGGSQLYEARPEAQAKSVDKQPGDTPTPPPEDSTETTVEPTVQELNAVLGGELLSPEEDTPWQK